MATNYDINYNDKRFQDVKNQEATAIKETQGKYDQMINQTDSFYQQQIDASKDWANKQSELQQAQTDFTIEKVEQAKEQAKKDYTKEQKGAYTDYQKATNQYGANAETLASQGLQESGYSESTRTNMYNTYQNRYMSARDSYTKAILNYDNSIKEAQLANSSALATIAYEALQKQLELSLQGFQYKNTLVLQKLEAVNSDKDRYYQRYQDVLQQINTENALAEQVRQYNEKMEEEKRQYNETLALQKEQLAEEKRQYNESLAFQKSKAAQEQANWQKEYALAQKKSSVSSGSSSSKSSSKLTNGSSSSKSSSSSSNKLSGSSSSSSSNKSSSSSSSSKTSSSSTSAKSNMTTVLSKALRLQMVSPNKEGYNELRRQFVYNEYKKGTITYAEAEKIFSKLGI